MEDNILGPIKPDKMNNWAEHQNILGKKEWTFGHPSFMEALLSKYHLIKFKVGL